MTKKQKLVLNKKSSKSNLKESSKIYNCNGIAIDSAKARECIEEMNKNTVSKKFLKKCEETAKLFKKIK